MTSYLSGISGGVQTCAISVEILKLPLRAISRYLAGREGRILADMLRRVKRELRQTLRLSQLHRLASNVAGTSLQRHYQRERSSTNQRKLRSCILL
jgi:hypothetical protein